MAHTRTIQQKITIAIAKTAYEYQKLLGDYVAYLQNPLYSHGRVLRPNHIQRLFYVARELIQKARNEPKNITDQLIIHIALESESKQKKLYRLKKFCAYLHYSHIITDQQFQQIHALHVPATPKLTWLLRPSEKKKWAVPFERWEEVYVQLDTINKRIAAWLGFNFGLRLGEIVHLKISDIIFSDPNSFGRLYIHTDISPEGTVWEPKTITSNRVLPISPAQQQILRTYLTERQEVLTQKFPKQYHSYLIFSNYGRPIAENTLYKWIKKVVLPFTINGESFLRVLRPHVLRYSAATHLYFKTRRIYEVSKFLGHASIKQTEEYLALGEDELFANIADVMKTAGL